ncbi:MAG TPA: ABC transporter ATP-binding protein [Thermoanaerobaculia bacterium]|jgi:ABC-2 type transport system ATP-binding protein
MTTAAPPLLELDGLEVRLGGRTVLAGLAGTLSGRIVGLLGPNGAGKTTLLATLLGFYPAHAGTARLVGRDIARDRAELKSRIGYMPETDAYIGHLTAVRFVRLMAELAGLPPKAALERTHETLFYVGLGEARYRKLETYSLGMKQLAKLAQAIAHGPEVLLLDEPTNGLDPGARQRMLRLIREIAETGVRIVVSSHLLRDVEAVCDEVIVLREGRVATIADLAAERHENRRFLELETRGGNGEFVAALAGLGCEVAELPNRRLKVVLPEGVAARELWRLAGERGVELRRLTSSRNSLEHLFLKAMEETRAGL